MTKHYKIIIPINSDECDSHRLQDNKVFASLASDISNRLWHLGYAPTGKVVVTYSGNEVIIPTMHPLNDDVKQWALEQCEQLYDPHPCGPARREECDGEC